MNYFRPIARFYEVYDEGHRLVPMEGLRGLAVLLVFFVHFHALFGRYAESNLIIYGASRFLGSVGNIGVDLFFVLSGYLIYGALLRKKSSYPKFIQRRLERIYPTFIAVFCIYLLLSALFHSENKIHGSFMCRSMYVLENLLLLPGILDITPIITVAWSLSYEFFFYLTLPVVVWLTQMRLWKRGARVTLFCMIWLFYIVYSFSVSRSRVRLLMFVAGILLFEAIGSSWLKNKLSRKGEIIAICMMISSLVLIYLYDTRADLIEFLPGLSAGSNNLPGVPTFQGPYKVIILSISCPLLALYSFEFNGILSKLFSWHPLRFLGNMSYSYYLIHGLTLHGVALAVYLLVPMTKSSLPTFLLLLPIGFVSTWIVSSLLFLLIEKPLSLRPRAGSGSRQELRTNHPRNASSGR